MECFVYLLRSDSTGRFYICQSSNLASRLTKHNRGESFATKHERPWKLVYTEKYTNRSEAIRRERFLKSPVGWKELQRIKQTVLPNTQP